MGHDNIRHPSVPTSQHKNAVSDPDHRVPWDEALRYKANYGVLPYGWTEREVELEREHQRQLVERRQLNAAINDKYMNIANQLHAQIAPRLLQNVYRPPVSQPAKAAPVQSESTRRYPWAFYRPTQQEQDDALIVASMRWAARIAVVAWYVFIFLLVFYG